MPATMVIGFNQSTAFAEDLVSVVLPAGAFVSEKATFSICQVFWDASMIWTPRLVPMANRAWFVRVGSAAEAQNEVLRSFLR